MTALRRPRKRFGAGSSRCELTGTTIGVTCFHPLDVVARERFVTVRMDPTEAELGTECGWMIEFKQQAAGPARDERMRIYASK